MEIATSSLRLILDLDDATFFLKDIRSRSEVHTAPETQSEGKAINP